MGMALWPFSRRKAPTEIKSLAAPDDALLTLFGALTSFNGISISTEQALNVPAVACAIRAISEAAGSLDLIVKRVMPDGSEEKAPDHPVAKLLASGVNEWMGAPELVTRLVGDALISDAGGFAYVSRTGDGRIVEVVRYRRGQFQVTLDPITEEPSFTVGVTPVRAQDVLYVRAPGGRAPLSLAKGAAAIATVLDGHAADLFAHGARPSGALVLPSGIGVDAVKKAIASWKATHEGQGKQGRTAFLQDGVTFEPFQLSSVDAQFQELRAFQVVEIARAFRIPPTMLFDLSRATWSNSEQMGREFLTYCLEPWLIQVEGALRRALFLPDEREQYVIRFDRDDLTRGDLASRVTAINSAIAATVLSPNEGREWLGLSPREGGDEIRNPNITPATEPAASVDEEEPSDDDE